MGDGYQRFPGQQPGVRYLTEGGQETELMYKHGFHLPEFALFPMLDDPAAVGMLRAMYESYLDTAARHGLGVLMGGLDYRASPDWASLLGYTPARLAEAQLRCIDFLREMAAPYRDEVPDLRIVGIVGPRGDAYEHNDSITANSAQDYHSVQLQTLREADVDLVSAMTFSNVEEAVGVSRAAAEAGLPLSVSFTLDSGTRRLHDGTALGDAITSVDRQAGDSRPDFYGINCSHPTEFAPAVEDAEWMQRIRMLRPNASTMEKVELSAIGRLEMGDWVALGDEMGALARRFPGIDVWGGCCGTWDLHLEEIARNVAVA